MTHKNGSPEIFLFVECKMLYCTCTVLTVNNHQHFTTTVGLSFGTCSYLASVHARLTRMLALQDNAAHMPRWTHPLFQQRRRVHSRRWVAFCGGSSDGLLALHILPPPILLWRATLGHAVKGIKLCLNL